MSSTQRRQTDHFLPNPSIPEALISEAIVKFLPLPEDTLVSPEGTLLFA